MKLIGSKKRFNNWKRNKFKTNNIINNNMRVFQRLFVNHIIKPRIISSKNIKPPPSFYRIPYDEQYEPRDFIREKKEEYNKKKKKETKS
tara:strand:- start:288 stop:554 length:267 start_codon:yes stop_codon:yes gene_type:complete